MLQPQSGKLPSGERLERIINSPNYRQGQFQNINPTPQLTEGANLFSVMGKFFFGKPKNSAPPAPLPSVKTDLHRLNTDENILVWFGHSSYFMQLDGKRILVDPVFSGYASPVSFTTKSFKGADIYDVEDFPGIDYLFITHDHWDHLDYQTVVKLEAKVGKVITGLGTGSHLEYWGFAPGKIIEMDWNETMKLDDGFLVHAAPARHFAGRMFKRNKSLWMSFVFLPPTKKIYIGGDSGYDTHFAEIGKQHGPFDLAILECGQYNAYWKYIHMMPEEVIQAGIDLGAKSILPVHWAKFSLALHEWDEPIKRVVAEGARKAVKVIHPLIGEKVDLDGKMIFNKWWETVK